MTDRRSMRDRIRDLTASARFGAGKTYAQLTANQKAVVDEIMGKQTKFSREGQ